MKARVTQWHHGRGKHKARADLNCVSRALPAARTFAERASFVPLRMRGVTRGAPDDRVGKSLEFIPGKPCERATKTLGVFGIGNGQSEHVISPLGAGKPHRDIIPSRPQVLRKSTFLGLFYSLAQ